MSKTLTTSSSYNNLIKAVNTALSRGILANQKSIEYHRLKTYWTIGKKICTYVSSSQGLIPLNQKLYEQISLDVYKDLSLKLTPDTLRRTIQFSKNYPQFPHHTILSFSHYIALQRITNKNLRQNLEQRAIRQNMSTTQIKKTICYLNAKPASHKLSSHAKKLPIERGEPFVYYFRTKKVLNEPGEPYIDCGFNISIPLNGWVLENNITSTTQSSRVIRVVKNERSFKIYLYKKSKSKLYTYPARIIRIIDGDTIDVRLDVGFGIRLSERLRLKAINTPELKTQEGKHAKQFLTDYFLRNPNIIVRTNKTGMYGRWIADIFMLKDETNPHLIAQQGEYLNQRLLDEGLAQPYL